MGKTAAAAGRASADLLLCPPESRVKKGPRFMKIIAYILGILLIIVAVVYFVLPADSLPSFFPGHVAGSSHMHYKHGIVAAVVGVILLAVGWFMGRRA
jgi:amino acid permease